MFAVCKMSFVLFGTVSQCCDASSILDGIFKIMGVKDIKYDIPVDNVHLTWWTWIILRTFLELLVLLALKPPHRQTSFADFNVQEHCYYSVDTILTPVAKFRTASANTSLNMGTMLMGQINGCSGTPCSRAEQANLLKIPCQVGFELTK